jgi:hypothetical protein
VTINGNPTGLVTPADVAASDFVAGRVEVSMRGFRPQLVHAGETQIRNGVVQVRLETARATVPPVTPAASTAPAPATFSVTLTGTYPFEVVDGSRVISEQDTSHTLTLAGPRVLRLRNAEYLLDHPVRVDAGRTAVSPPDLGRLTVRTPLETCKVWVADRDLGYPPITEQRLAAGSYRVEVRCPDGTTKSDMATIEAGRSNTKVIR